MTPSRRSFGLALVATGLASVACDVERIAPYATASQAIVGGTVDTEHRSVVAVTSPQNPNASYCTGTVITPTVVVTAAHCVLGAKSHDADLFVYFGDAVGDGGTSIAVVEALAHPDFSLSQLGSSNDVGLLRLASPAPVPPIPFGNPPIQGAAATLVGFGYDTTNETGIGTRRQRAQTIGTVTPGDFVLVDSGSCDGDSGGAVLVTGTSGLELVGVHSQGGCGGTSREARIDVLRASFVVPFVNAAATCDPDGACALDCAAPDPDCGMGEGGGGQGGAGGGSTATTGASTGGGPGGIGGAGGAGGDASDAPDDDDGGCAVSSPASPGSLDVRVWLLLVNALILMGIRRQRRR